MRASEQKPVWEFIVAYNQVFGAALSYIRLVREDAYFAEAVARARVDGDARLRHLAWRMEELQKKSMSSENNRLAPVGNQKLPRKHQEADGPGLAELKAQLSECLDQGLPDVDTREALDQFCREHGINLRDAADLEMRLRRERGLARLDWVDELSAAIRGLQGPDGLSERDRLRLYEIFIKRNRLSISRAESILESLRPTPATPARRPRPVLAGGAVVALLFTVLAALVPVRDGLLAVDEVAGGVIYIDGSIAEDTVWRSENTYRMQGVVFVEPEVMLTIQAGTRIVGEYGSALVVTRGANLHARGRPDAPIVLTSARPEGERRRGDWGGIVMLGAAPVNTGEGHIEGVPVNDPRGDFGGNDPDGSCGLLEYVRIEFAGYELSANNELNGLTLGGCGAGTVLRYIQVHRGLDDGIEFFGGTADLRNAVITGAGDDGLDWDMGWRGRVQHLVIQQYQEDGDNAIEADSLKSNHEAEPRSAPTLYNVTLVGSRNLGAGQRAMTLRRGTAGTFRNFIIAGFPLELLDVRDQATVRQAELARLSFNGGLIHDIGDGLVPMINAEDVNEDDDSGFNERSLFTDRERISMDAGSMALSMKAFEQRSPRFHPNTVPAVVDLAVPIPRGEFWDEGATYLGAIRPGGEATWLDGWTDYPVN